MDMKPTEIADEALETVSGGRHEEQELIIARELKTKLDGKTVRVALLYCVTAKEISSAIDEQLDIHIDKKSIELPEIRKTGTYNFKVKIAAGITAVMAVLVT